MKAAPVGRPKSAKPGPSEQWSPRRPADRARFDALDSKTQQSVRSQAKQIEKQSRSLHDGKLRYAPTRCWALALDRHEAITNAPEPGPRWTQADRLTWEKYQAGAPCPGCGLPYLGDEREEAHGTGWMTVKQLTAHDDDDVEYLRRHGKCRSHRHSVSRSLVTHCGHCCPPPPLSPSQVEKIAAIFLRAERDTQDWLARNPECAACGQRATTAPYFWTTTKPRREVRRSLCSRCHDQFRGDSVTTPDLPESLGSDLITNSLPREDRRCPRLQRSPWELTAQHG
jgi:hypothetical protein